MEMGEWGVGDLTHGPDSDRIAASLTLLAMTIILVIPEPFTSMVGGPDQR